MKKQRKAKGSLSWHAHTMCLYSYYQFSKHLTPILSLHFEKILRSEGRGYLHLRYTTGKIGLREQWLAQGSGALAFRFRWELLKGCVVGGTLYHVHPPPRSL